MRLEPSQRSIVWTASVCCLFAIALLLILVGASTGAAAGTSDASTVRVFAIGNKLEIRYADTYLNFHDKICALADAGHPRRAELVQAGVDDVASHLPGADRNAPSLSVVNFPEDVGLIAGLIGTRGAAARRANLINGGSVAAFGSLIQKYDPQIRYYSARWPGLPVVRYLLLAETDTLYRACYETFRELAQTYGVYVTATFNVASARRVQLADDPDLVRLLRDPDEVAVRDYAYVADAPEVYNSTFLFDPSGNVLVDVGSGSVGRSPADTDGEIRGSWRKAYLTEPEQDTLPLAYGAVRDLEVLDTPIGKITSVISKDAWMIDVNDRLDAKGAQLVIQPEAFSEWAFTASPWQPDGFKAGGFAQVQRNPSFQFNVTPSLTGNLFEITFDGQSAILGKRSKSATTGGAFIGQVTDPGFLRVGPWIRDEVETMVPIEERRTALATDGQHLLPGAKPRCATALDYGACENGYRESVIFRDLTLSAPTPANSVVEQASAFSAAVRVDNSPSGARWARVAADADRVYIVWQDDRFGMENIMLAVSLDGGKQFRELRVSDNVSGSVNEIRPALAFHEPTGNLFVVWQEMCAGTDDNCGKIKLARFDRLGEKIGTDVRVDTNGGSAGKWNAAVTADKAGNPLVTWVDERDHGPQGIPLEHIYFARGQHRGASVLPDVRVDRGTPVKAATSLDNKWNPSIGVWGRRIYVAWTDFRNYNWDIYLSRSLNGRHFSQNTRVDDSTIFERLHDHPSVATDRQGAVHVAWADRRAVDSDTNIFYSRSTDGGNHFEPSRRIDSSAEMSDPDAGVPSNQWAPRIVSSAADIFVVWQDNRLGDNDIFMKQSADGGSTFEADERVDDSGTIPSNQYRPDVAVDENAAGNRVVYCAWEDDRWGGSHIALAHRPTAMPPSSPSL
ncbi:MAG: hypothetical protein HY270_11695 [Deltaproteobacteria bacterium]|nr:hypothetical protein [Deltaproteobacteria bacterium]